MRVVPKKGSCASKYRSQARAIPRLSRKWAKTIANTSGSMRMISSQRLGWVGEGISVGWSGSGAAVSRGQAGVSQVISLNLLRLLEPQRCRQNM